MQKETFSLNFTSYIKIYALIICSSGTKNYIQDTIKCILESTK